MVVKPKTHHVSSEPVEQKSPGWWAGFLAMALVKVIHARTFDDARAVARASLREFATQFDDIPEGLRRSWMSETKEE